MQKQRSRLGVVILAAGLGKRMKSPLPKVLHEISGKPLIFHILSRVQEAAPDARVALVVGHGREQVEAFVRETPRFSSLAIEFIHQPTQLGTGDAARCAMESSWGQTLVREKAPILLLPGDLPLISANLVHGMIEPLAPACPMRLLTCPLPEPSGYGRVVRRGKSGPVLRIVEEKDANLREKSIQEVGASIYFFQSPFFRAGLQKLSPKNAQGEFYLTDLVAQASRSRSKIDVLKWGQCEDLRGINDPWELSQASRMLNERILRAHALAGVSFTDPLSNYIDVTAEIAPGATIRPGAQIAGESKIGAGAVIGSHSTLKNVVVGAGAEVRTGTIAEDSEIGADAKVGPYAHLRPGSKVGARAKIGNFVELKKAVIGADTSIAHLSYLGDADVGARVNIGCGFVTCNFDGRVIDGSRKHKTTIEDDVFLGSDCQCIAPVRIGRGAYVASGSTITEDVESDALAIARSRQVNKPGYAKRLRERE